MFGLRDRKIKKSVGKQIHFVQEAATTNKKADKNKGGQYSLADLPILP